jgi:hypothetical protein
VATVYNGTAGELRFLIKGHRLPVTDRRLPAFRELADAGIMAPDGEEFRFTEEGRARREELLSAAEAHLRSADAGNEFGWPPDVRPPLRWERASSRSWRPCSMLRANGHPESVFAPAE